MKITPAASLLLLTGCLAAPPSEDDAVTETGQALAQAPDEGGASDAVALDDLPRWHAYLSGLDGTAHAHLDVRPPTIDHFGQVVAIRAGDEAKPERWVYLSLAEHWRKGDCYFDELIEAGRVTAIDLLMIASYLLKKRGNIDPLSTPPRTCARVEGGGGGGDWSPLPGILGGDHTGGPGPDRNPSPRPGQGKGGGKTIGSEVGHGTGPSRPIVIRPKTPEELAKQAAYEAAADGVEPGDPKPAPSPFDKHYEPKAGERRVPFKCEGTVYSGYKRGCIDFRTDVVDGVKWERKLSAWEGRYFDPKNIAMTHADWTTLCKVMASLATATGCLAAVGTCGTAEIVTLGSVTIPCFWLTAVMCSAHSGAGGLLFERCPLLMGAR